MAWPLVLSAVLGSGRQRPGGWVARLTSRSDVGRGCDQMFGAGVWTVLTAELAIASSTVPPGYLRYPDCMDLLTRYVLENPWPLAVLLLAVAAGLAWTGLQAVDRRRVIAAGVVALTAAGVMAAGKAVVTPGEHARGVVMAVVDAAVAADVGTAAAALADDVSLSLGSQNNPGFARDAIVRRLDGLAGRYRIQSNRITKLDAETVTPDRGVVQLACLTELKLGFGPVPTSWIIQVDRQSDGSWKISHVTWVKLATRTPPRSW